jgi:hypothetical protein
VSAYVVVLMYVCVVRRQQQQTHLCVVDDVPPSPIQRIWVLTPISRHGYSQQVGQTQSHVLEGVLAFWDQRAWWKGSSSRVASVIATLVYPTATRIARFIMMAVVLWFGSQLFFSDCWDGFCDLSITSN